MTSNSTTAQLRHDIDRGATGDRSPSHDPATAPLGTDEEAAGTPPAPETVAQARRAEAKPHLSATANSPSPSTSPQGQSSRTVSPGAATIVLLSFAVLGIAAVLVIAMG